MRRNANKESLNKKLLKAAKKNNAQTAKNINKSKK
jgi:hypothetical protein